MSMKKYSLAVLAIAGATMFKSPAFAEVVAHCGASQGISYYFYDEVFNPDAPGWVEDGISSGRIILVREGDEWDILFGDAAGSTSYRNDGAVVVLLAQNERFITVGAFTPFYSETYTFNLVDNEVVWTSHKTGTPVPKVAIYRSDCS